jgi:hypothetical protein
MLLTLMELILDTRILRLSQEQILKVPHTLKSALKTKGLMLALYGRIQIKDYSRQPIREKHMLFI